MGEPVVSEKLLTETAEYGTTAERDRLYSKVDELRAALAASRERGDRLLAVVKDAREWIASESHAAGCSGRFPPHRCKCGVDEFVAEMDAALADPEGERS